MSQIMPEWWYGPWATPAELRKRPDADRIDGYKVMSGRPAPITDRYWDACVIEVAYRVRPALARELGEGKPDV